MTGNNCLHMIFNPSKLIPDFHPTSFKQAKKQLKDLCISKNSIGVLTGTHFRLTYLSEEERGKFLAYANRICENTLKRWVEAKKK